MKTNYFLSLLLLLAFSAHAQQTQVYPPNWWVGMKTSKIQLLIYSDAPIASAKASMQHQGVRLLQTHTFENPKYLALDIEITDKAKPGALDIVLEDAGKKQTLPWALNARREGNGTAFAQGVNTKDFIDLLIVDRFSNGDPSNDRVPGLKDQSLNRDSIHLRHGGDLQGVLNHLDYFEQLGVTALWLLPVQENDMYTRTEHGYAITNHYKIDARFGGEAKYKELSDALHKRGMKLIMDAVYNHVGLYHFLEQDPPAKDWMHRWPSFTQTTYREQTIFDPYAATSETKKMTDGWFVDIMPDINHHNPFMANYIIQNMIWYIEMFGIDGIRVDTYTYNDGEFSNRCNAAVMNEYPKMTLFGEAMVHGVPNQAYFTENNFNTPFKSNLQGAVDFQCLYYGITPALTEAFGWTSGVNRLYYTLSSDFMYKDPTRNVLILDNHDEPRFFSLIGEDVAKQKIGYQWLLTCRGIPQLYYGSEVLMKGIKNPDLLVRADFPGGWEGDKKNAFTGEGLSQTEAQVQDLVKKLGTFRKKSTALTAGKMMHYVPVDGLYVYFRYDAQQTVMCVMNTSQQAKQVDFSKYAERTQGFAGGRNVIDGSIVKTNASIGSMEMWVLELLP